MANAWRRLLAMKGWSLAEAAQRFGTKPDRSVGREDRRESLYAPWHSAFCSAGVGHGHGLHPGASHANDPMRSPYVGWMAAFGGEGAVSDRYRAQRALGCWRCGRGHGGADGTCQAGVSPKPAVL